jgi:hypothetical protein
VATPLGGETPRAALLGGGATGSRRRWVDDFLAFCETAKKDMYPPGPRGRCIVVQGAAAPLDFEK